MKPASVILIPIVSLVLAGCGGSSPAAPSTSGTASADTPVVISAAPPTEPKLQTVSIGVVSPAAAHAPLLVALFKDYFKDAGLQVDYQTLGNAELASAGLAAGHLDVAVTVPSVALFNALSRGLETKIVSSMGAYPADGQPAALVARKDLVDGGQVKSLADLKGRKVALGGGKEATQGYFTELLLHQAGMTLNDIDVVNLSFGDTVLALTNKSIDAGFLPDPFKTQAKQKDIAVSIAKEGIPGRGGVTTLFSARFVAQRRELASAVMLALVRGARDLQGDGVKSDDNLAAISKYTKLPVETLKASDSYTYDPNLTPDTETILGMQQLFLSNRQLSYTTPLAEDRLIDVSFSLSAAEKLGSSQGGS